jgi:hypothetical protein
VSLVEFPCRLTDDAVDGTVTGALASELEPEDTKPRRQFNVVVLYTTTSESHASVAHHLDGLLKSTPACMMEVLGFSIVAVAEMMTDWRPVGMPAVWRASHSREHSRPSWTNAHML